MNQKFDVVHLTTVHNPGDNRIYRKECTTLHEAGVSVALVCATDSPQPEGFVPVVTIPKRRGRLSRMLRGPVDAWRVLRRLDPTLAHVHDPELIPLAVLWARRPGKAAVFDAHEDLAKQVAGKPYLPRWSRPVVARAARLLEVIADRGCTAVVAATGPIAKNFRKAPVTLVQNFPWLREYPHPSSPPKGAPTVVYVGGLSRARGSRQIVEAVQRAKSQPSLILAGPITPEALEDVEKLGSRLDYRGLLPAESVPSVVAAGSIGIVLFQPLPNHLEAQPTKLFEYMAAGRPYIASDFPFWRALVGDSGGYFVDPTDPSAVAAQIDSLALDLDAAQENGALARRVLEMRFTFEAESQRLVAMTKSLLSPPS